MGFPPPMPSTAAIVTMGVIVFGLPCLLVGLGLGWWIWG